MQLCFKLHLHWPNLATLNQTSPYCTQLVYTLPFNSNKNPLPVKIGKYSGNFFQHNECTKHESTYTMSNNIRRCTMTQTYTQPINKLLCWHINRQTDRHNKTWTHSDVSKCLWLAVLLHDSDRELELDCCMSLSPLLTNCSISWLSVTESWVSWINPATQNDNKVKVKQYSSSWQVISELRGVTCHMGSHSVAFHPTQVKSPRLTPARQAGTRFTYPGGMEGWVDLIINNHHHH